MSDSPTAFSTLTPALSPAFISADDAAVYAHQLIVSINQRVMYGGFILSRDHQFFATLPVAGEQHSFDPAQVLSLSSDGMFLSIENYAIEGMYHSTTPMYRRPWAINEESGLQDNFFSITDLNMAIRYRSNYPKFYLSCPDKGVLSYISGGSDLEQAILPLISRKRYNYPSMFERAYDQGYLMPTNLINLLVLMGTLNVVLPGGRWSKRARLGVNWQQDQQNPQLLIDQHPVCSKLLPQAAEAVLSLMPQMLLCKDEQHAGYILMHPERNRYACTLPLKTPYAEFDRNVVFPKNANGVPTLPEGYRVMGIYHSGDVFDSNLPDVLNELFGDFFSPNTLRISLWLARSMPNGEVYFFGRRGGLLRYQSTGLESETELLAMTTGTVGTRSALEEQLLSLTLSPQDYVRRVAAAGRLEVISTDEMWTVTGLVTQTWAPSVPVAVEEAAVISDT